MCCVKSIQSCPALCDPMDHRSWGSTVHGILLARILEWVAISYSRGSSQPRDWTHVLSLLHWQMDSLPLMPPGKDIYTHTHTHIHNIQSRYCSAKSSHNQTDLVLQLLLWPLVRHLIFLNFWVLMRSGLKLLLPHTVVVRICTQNT